MEAIGGAMGLPAKRQGAKNVVEQGAIGGASVYW